MMANLDQVLGELPIGEGRGASHLRRQRRYDDARRHVPDVGQLAHYPGLDVPQLSPQLVDDAQAFSRAISASTWLIPSPAA
jgi:hypothetical protein